MYIYIYPPLPPIPLPPDRQCHLQLNKTLRTHTVTRPRSLYFPHLAALDPMYIFFPPASPLPHPSHPYVRSTSSPTYLLIHWLPRLYLPLHLSLSPLSFTGTHYHNAVLHTKYFTLHGFVRCAGGRCIRKTKSLQGRFSYCFFFFRRRLLSPSSVVFFFCRL